MPIYEYSCSNCESHMEKFLKISQMEEPLSEACPDCGSTNTISQVPTAASIGDPIRLGVKRPDAGWNEVLGKIKEKHPRGNWNNSRFSGRGTV